MIGGGGTGTIANEDVIGNGFGIGVYVQYKTSPAWISEIWEDSVFSDLTLKSSINKSYCDYSLLGIEESLLFYSRTPEVQVYLGGGFGYQFVDRRTSVHLEETSNPLYSSMGIDFGESIDDGLSA